MARSCSSFAALLLALGVLVGSCGVCRARVYIDINAPRLRKIPTAVPLFKNLGADDKEEGLSETLADLLAETIDFTGFFKILDRKSFLENPQEAGLRGQDIAFKNWTSVGAELLVKGGFTYQEGRLRVELRLFDTVGGRLVVGKRYTGKGKDRRRIIRRFCNDIVYVLTGHAGIFDTRIAFVSTTTGHKEIYIADFDGHDPTQFTNTGAVTLFPAWSSDGRWLAYTDFKGGKPDLYVRDIKMKQGTVLSVKGSSITPAWVPGEFALAASLSYEGNPSLYQLTGKGKIVKRLTYHWDIDVAPTWSPDGRAFAFVSNRSGSAQVFVKSVENGKVRRLTYQGRYNTSPQWSPTSNTIAYAGLGKDGRMDIYVISTKGNSPVQLTKNAGDNESPTWSPDGSLMAFSSTRLGPSRIFVMNANGANQRCLLVLEGEQSNPAWSPRLSGH